MGQLTVGISQRTPGSPGLLAGPGFQAPSLAGQEGVPQFALPLWHTVLCIPVQGAPTLCKPVLSGLRSYCLHPVPLDTTCLATCNLACATRTVYMQDTRGHAAPYHLQVHRSAPHAPPLYFVNFRARSGHPSVTTSASAVYVPYLVIPCLLRKYPIPEFQYPPPCQYMPVYRHAGTARTHKDVLRLVWPKCAQSRSPVLRQQCCIQVTQ